ncbi:beta-lactamase family protein [Nocardia cyriacigeorgica]|uniref:serine hydrolase domain-containing protein n=1 Tax=Nocardia cyriacigeorgica TaxID=135487 RepID=UPI0013BE3C26|nr:serine hydrolase domain-containing protein [Nocardia cyriacigeorgica]NEW50862.1 beta-lactamase family protein [Nocardia cyriacigeorgica]
MAILLGRLVLLLPVLAMLSTCAPTAGGETITADDGVRYPAMDAYVRAQMDTVRIPGVAYAVVEPQGIAHSGTFGTDGDGRPVTKSTPFLWGSVAKPVTATLVMTLVESGELELDMPVVTYLPSFRMRDEARSERITIRHLLDQTSGIPTSTRFTDRTEPGRRPIDTVAELADEASENEPGAAHHYSSTNYLLLAAVVEQVTGRPFTAVLADRVLDPMGMRSAITDQDRADANLPPGHRFVFGRPMSFDAPFDPAGVAYGYLGGSLHDAAAFAAANLGGPAGVLAESQRAAMFRGEIETGERRSYGLGWRRWTVEGTTEPMVWHGGAGPGYWAQIILLPDQNRAVVLLADAYGTFHEPRLLETGFGLARLLHGLPPAGTADHTYSAVLATLLGIAGLLIALVLRSIWQLTHPAGVRRRWMTLTALAVWGIGLACILYGFSVVVPGQAGVGLDQIVLWTPDVAWLLYTILAAAGLLVALRIAVATRLVRSGAYRPST